MSDLQIFTYGENEVRTVFKDGGCWWVLADVCKVLELSNSRVVAERLEEDEVSQAYITDRLGREQETRIINESGLYNVILRSDKPQAKPFRKWVTSEVLPSIRKHGIYATDDTLEQLIENPDFGIRLLKELKAERDKVKERDKVIEELKPKADYLETILNSPALVNANQIAKDYGFAAKTLNKLLKERKVQYRQGKQWLLYEKYQDKGYVGSETFEITKKDGTVVTKMRTKWTQKGRKFIYELLKADGIIPLIEKREKTA